MGLIEALGRFGSFSGVSELQSGTFYDTTNGAQSGLDNTPGFSFTSSTYSSPYVAFKAYEAEERMATRCSGSINRTMASGNSSAISTAPFMDFAGRIAAYGIGFSPAIVVNKSWSSIAAELYDSASLVGSEINAQANAYSAIICGITNGEPASVCQSMLEGLPTSVIRPHPVKKKDQAWGATGSDSSAGS